MIEAVYAEQEESVRAELSKLGIACTSSDAIEMGRQVVEEKAPRWFLVFRDVTNSTNERTLISAIVPWAAMGHKAPVLRVGCDKTQLLCLLANLNCIVLDYVARQKIGGTSMSYFVLKQLPIVPPGAYTSSDCAYISERALRLTFTTTDLTLLGNEFNQSSPTSWDALEREMIRADLDAYYAHLYGLTREDLRYILDPKDIFGDDFPSQSFRVLKEREEKELGEFRTRRLVLAAFDELADTPRFKDQMLHRVSAFEVPAKPLSVGKA